MNPNDPLVLVIDDEPEMRRFLRNSLMSQDYRVIEAANAAEGLSLASQYVPDLVLLDLGLPDLDGIQVITRLRGWSQVPIVVLSAREHERHKVAALDAGADDYLTKPFGFAEMLARMRVALRHASRRAGVPDDDVIEVGALRIDLASRVVAVQGRDVHLSPIEFKLLVHLARHAGKVLTQKQLLEAVWGRSGQPHYLRVYMTHLRRKLESEDARLFINEPGVGYRLRSDG